MALIPISDIARMTSLRSQQSGTKTALDTAALALASGKKQDITAAVGGDLSGLFRIVGEIETLTSDAAILQNVAGKTGVMQLVLSDTQSRLDKFGPDLLSAISLGDTQNMRAIGKTAENALRDMFSALNKKYGRHTLFSGDAVDRPPLGSADALLSDISSIVATAPDTGAAISAINTYFDSPSGGFSASIYSGSTQDVPAALLSNGNRIRYGMRADDPAIKAGIRSLAIAAVVARSATYSGGADDRGLLKEAAVSALNASSGIIDAQEWLGNAQEQISLSKAHGEAAITVFKLHRNEMESADPFDAAARVKALQGQLEAIYIMTAQLSGMSLANYLR